jgi:hypothetical protein
MDHDSDSSRHANNSSLTLPACLLHCAEAVGWSQFLAGNLAAYVLWKFIQRRRFLRRLRIARISPKELMDKLTAKENISIVDLRQPMDIEAFPQMIPGALRMAMEEIEERHGEVPRDRDVVLYCS